MSWWMWVLAWMVGSVPVSFVGVAVCAAGKREDAERACLVRTAEQAEMDAFEDRADKPGAA